MKARRTTKPDGMKSMRVDVMTQGGEKFYCTLWYKYEKKIDLEALGAWVHERRPMLKYEKGVTLFLDYR